MKKNEEEDNPSKMMEIAILFTQMIAVVLIIGAIAISSMPDKVSIPAGPVDVAKDVVYPMTVLVSDKSGFGTGFHLRHNGRIIILTNRHVCQGNPPEFPDVIKGKKILIDGREESVIAISTDEKIDLCAITSSNILGLRLADNEPTNGTRVQYIGHPEGLGKVIKDARVITYRHQTSPWEINPVRVMLISGETWGGESGSPVFNSDGDVQGVLYARNSDPIPHGVVVPLTQIKKFLKDDL